MDGQYWRPNHVNKRVVADIWLLTVSWTLTWEMMRIRNFYCFVYRQHIWLRKWEVIVGDMIDHVGIYGSRVAEGLSTFNVGLVIIVSPWFLEFISSWGTVPAFECTFELYISTQSLGIQATTMAMSCDNDITMGSCDQTDFSCQHLYHTAPSSTLCIWRAQWYFSCWGRALFERRFVVSIATFELCGCYVKMQMQFQDSRRQ